MSKQLVVQGISKRFGGLAALSDVSLTLEAGELVGLIGPNGSGKTTFLNVASGYYRADSGRAAFQGRSILRRQPYELAIEGIARTFQVTKVFRRLTVLENLLVPGLVDWASRRHEAQSAGREILDKLGLASLADERAANLSGGQGKLLEFGRIMMLEPKIILLDEPFGGVHPELKRLMHDILLEWNGRGVTVEARSGQLTTVIGANGVGKSTLLKCIVGQLRSHSGQIRLDGTDIGKASTHQLVRLGLAYVAQRRGVFPHMTVRENLQLGTWSFRRDSARVEQVLARAYQQAPILEQFRQRKAGDLSGGQQRLLEIERALLADPQVLLVDEPTVGLDPKMADFIYDHLRRLITEAGRTVLMVDQNVIAGIDVADYIYVLELGGNKLEGTKADFDSQYRKTIASWLL